MLETTVTSHVSGYDCETVCGQVAPGVTFTHKTFLTPEVRINRSIIRNNEESGVPYGEPGEVLAVKQNRCGKGVMEWFLGRMTLFGAVRLPPEITRPELMASMFLALDGDDFVPSFEGILSRTRKETRAFRVRDFGTKHHQKARAIKPRVEGERWDDWQGPTKLGDLKFDDWIAIWSLESAAGLSGLDESSVSLLRELYSAPCRTQEREWNAVGAICGLDRYQVEASARKIKRYAPAIAEWLSQRTETRFAPLSYDLNEFSGWLQRQQASLAERKKRNPSARPRKSPRASSVPGVCLMRDGVWSWDRC